ncbi:MAG: FAD-binding oxidoreductase [Fidelibacterota bacterium]
MAVSPGDTLQSDLRQIFSPDHITPAEDHVPSRFTVFPTEVEQICELVALARKRAITLLPVGGTTQLYSLPEPLDVAVSLTRLGGSLQHNPHDLTATAPAGLPFAGIQQKLARKGQMLPLDFPGNKSSTLGGIVSTNFPGPLRHRYGSARDWVLGTAVVNGHGQVSRAGGKVVKNVSGYDLNKLYIGSRGTLGILIEISFKLHPLPEARSTWGVRFNGTQDILEAAASLRRTPLPLESLVILNGNWIGETPGTWLLIARLAGSKSALKTQEHTLKSHLERFVPAGSLLKGKEADALWKRTDRPYSREAGAPAALARVSMGIKGLQRLLQEETLGMDAGLRIKAYPGVGICVLAFDSDGDLDSWPEERIVRTINKMGGFVEFESLPAGSTLERWPILPSSLSWMKKIKKALDPDSVFAPGTFVGGV